ncbi:hypothetical protein KVH17_02990 [Streptomyces olivaceus]|uniref:hypothetical protein n=1 Tax=Streptomyces olivaceus TaxID=47716 RepID=UPI001CCAA45A|nr:hypothetical protein [Streptomyces olivaceus]MBZ6079991.1 hypothetical protein [Streptomyces olivaceus]MBZ6198680.1 hypothetical protein [Streptomyces olivaceus]
MRPRSPRPRATPTALAALTALTLAACSSTDEPDPAPPTPSNRTTAPHPTAGSPAADGQDPDACTDGNCEITVTKPVTLHFPAPGDGRATLSVTEVGPNKIEYEVKSANGQSKAGASGPGQGCLTYLRENGTGNSCGPLTTTRPTPQPDTVTIQTTTTPTGPGLLRIVSP